MAVTDAVKTYRRRVEVDGDAIFNDTRDVPKMLLVCQKGKERCLGGRGHVVWLA